MNEAKLQLQEVKESLAQLDPNNRDHLADIARLKTLEVELSKQVELQQKQEQRHEELQELVRGYNFNEVFGNPEANKIIHQLLYEESLKYENRLETVENENDRLNGEVLAANEREVNLKHQNESLQTQVTDIEEINEQLNASFNKLRGENDELKVKYEEVLKDSRYHMNEATRLKAKVSDLEERLYQAEKQKDEFKPSGSLADMVATAKAETEKRKLMNIRQIDRANYVGIDEEGNEVTVNWLELPKIEEVSQFRLPEPVLPVFVEQSDAQADVSQFPNQEEAGSQLAEGNEVADGEPSVQPAVTREEFQALAERVAKLESVA